MRFYYDSDLESDVVWYFVPSTRPTLGRVTAFGSQIYNRDCEPQGAIGERYTPVPWRGGQPPGNVGIKGLCGTDKQWREGASAFDPLLPLWPGTAVPTCCERPPEQRQGGIGLGGRAVVAMNRQEGGIALGGQVLVEVPSCALGPTSVSMLWTVADAYWFGVDGVPITLNEASVYIPALDLYAGYDSGPITDDCAFVSRFFLVCTFITDHYDWVLHVFEEGDLTVAPLLTAYPDTPNVAPDEWLCSHAFAASSFGCSDILDAEIAFSP